MRLGRSSARRLGWLLVLFRCDWQLARSWLQLWWYSASTTRLVDFGRKRDMGACAIGEPVNIRLWMRKCIVLSLLIYVRGQFSRMSLAFVLWCDSIRVQQIEVLSRVSVLCLCALRSICSFDRMRSGWGRKRDPIVFWVPSFLGYNTSRALKNNVEV
jgi:hypothetical protein